MKVVSNASPLCYLSWIGAAEVLPALFGRILLTEKVMDELRHPSAPPEVRRLMAGCPVWLQVEKTQSADDPSLSRLHGGERDTILLAVAMGADLVLLDERLARDAAVSKGIRVAGTLGVLAFGASRGMLDLPSAIERLMRTSFRASPSLLRRVLNGSP